MAKFTWSGTEGFQPYLFDVSGLVEADRYERSSTTFKAVYEFTGNSYDKFEGYGFTYDAFGVPTGGTVTSYKGVNAGRTVATLTDVQVSVAKIAAVADTYTYTDDVKLLQSVLSGKDQITGGRYGDTLSGFGGNDTITGGGGADYLTGGRGADRFVFKSVSDSRGYNTDDITDFSRSQGDKIDLSKIDARTGVAGNQAFTFIGEAEFSGRKGQLRYESFGSESHVQADVNGDGHADFEITLIHVSTVAKGFFIL
jgi:Ca2+-binding RTX toxin-like protein